MIAVKGFQKRQIDFSNSRLYRHPEWKAYREKIVELDDFRCRRCERSESDGAILQVHHTEYRKNRLPWEYAYELCITLCKGCHAKEHSKVPPSEGWTFLSEDNLGDLIGNCEYCDTRIQHVYQIGHPNWGVLAVGTDCCDNLTGANDASNIRREASRLGRFVDSSRWKRDGDDLFIKQGGMAFMISPVNAGFQIVINGFKGRMTFPTIQSAKETLFANVENGECEKYLRKKGIPERFLSQRMRQKDIGQT